ncbi:uncharacterized protein [Aegilops tauschii subsp. strangulata]|uniref:KIB1-4 beta-propeller domain-containing protein n=1 Tax=Aegilops tauschii TaxID=37682 RepID=R7WC54_AEGTA
MEPSAGRWSDLPDELVGMVRSRIASLGDRVRFLAVCKSWRAVAPWQPTPPAAPLLLLSLWAGWGEKHMCGPDGSWVFRVPSKADGKQFLGSHDGGWVVVFDSHVLTVVNLFSGVEVALSPKQSRPAFFMKNMQKIIFSQHPTSSNGCILAAIVENWSQIALCRLGCSEGEWTTYGRHEWTAGWRRKVIFDIAFCNGELYGLMGNEGEGESELLVRFEIGAKKDGTPVIITNHELPIQRPSGTNDCLPYARYIFELHGKPSMAVMTRWLPNREPFFRVFKLVDAGIDEVCEAEVTSFDDYALFLGTRWSKAVHVPVGVGHHSPERNHIYYSTYSPENKSSGDEVYSVISNHGTYIEMCCKKDQTIEDGVDKIGYYVSARNDAVWLLPPDL